MSSSTSTTSQIPQAGKPSPGNLRPQARKRPKPPPLPPLPPLHPEADEDSLKNGFTWPRLWKAIRQSIHSAVAAGYGLSILLHALLLLAVSLMVYTVNQEDNFIESSIETSEKPVVFDEITDVRMDVPSGSDSAKKDALETAIDMETVDMANSSISTGVENSVESLFEKDGEQGEGGASFLVPQDSKIFKKGSFTAWTVPDDPGPGEDYTIVILVKLPDRVKRYRATDLNGIVIGTDGYRQKLPGPEYRRGNVYLPIKDRQAQVTVKVPGGAARVQDKIEVRSTTLKEEQTIQIEF